MTQTSRITPLNYPHSVTVLGAGAWGKALRSILMSQGVTVTWWNRSHKPHTTQDLATALANDPTVIMAISSAYVPELCQSIARLAAPLQRIWITSKGLDPETGDVLSTALKRHWPEASIGILAGPNIASEVAQGWHCGITLASNCHSLLDEARQWFDQSSLWSQISKDLVGVQWWSVLKNIVAIGYGLLEQKKAGHNLSATYLTMAMQEIAEFAELKGGVRDTALTFAAVGDVILTSHCPQGRNRVYGERFPAPPNSLVEGLETLKTLRQMPWFLGPTTPLPLLRSVALALQEPTADQGAHLVLSCMNDVSKSKPFLANASS